MTGLSTLCYIEKWFTKRVPEILKLVVVPFMALFITGILTVTIIGPAAREIGNYIALIFKTLMLTPGLKYLGGFAGTVVNSYGYGAFFTGTAMLGVPVLVLVWLAGRVLGGGEKDAS